MGGVKEVEFWKHKKKQEQAQAIVQQPPLQEQPFITGQGVKITKDNLDNRRFVAIKTDNGEIITGKIQSIDEKGNATIKIDSHGVKKLVGFKTKKVNVSAQSIYGVGKTEEEAIAKAKQQLGIEAPKQMPPVYGPPKPQEEKQGPIYGPPKPAEKPEEATKTKTFGMTGKPGAVPGQTQVPKPVEKKVEKPAPKKSAPKPAPKKEEKKPAPKKEEKKPAPKKEAPKPVGSTEEEKKKKATTDKKAADKKAAEKKAAEKKAAEKAKPATGSGKQLDEGM